MFCDFRKAFGLDPEYNKQLEESMQEAEKKALKEKWCCTCEYYIRLILTFLDLWSHIQSAKKAEIQCKAAKSTEGKGTQSAIVHGLIGYERDL